MGYIPTIHQNMPISHFPNQQERIKHIFLFRQKVQANITLAQEWMIKSTKFCAYATGDRVWLDWKNLKTSHPAVKLCAKQQGPFTIMNVISHIAYQLDLLKNWKIHNMFHASLLSPYKEMEEHGPNFTEPPPDLINGEEEWEVEHMLDTRLFGHKKQQQYKIRWKGYSSTHNSWEPEDNVSAKDLITEFKTRHKQNIKAITICQAKIIPTPITTCPMSFAPKKSSPPSIMKKSTATDLPIAAIIPKGNIHFVDSPGGTIIVHYEVLLDVPPPIPHTCVPHPMAPLRADTLFTSSQAVNMSARQAGKQKEYKIPLQTCAQEFPGYLLTKEEHMVMYLQEFIHWYTDPLAKKGYRQLPTWLPDELLKRFGPLSHNPNNNRPTLPNAADQIQSLEEEEVPLPLTVAMTDKDIFCPLTLSPAPLPIPLHDTTPITSTPVFIPKEEAIDLDVPIKVPADEAIDLTYLDNEDEAADNTSVSYHVCSPTTSIHKITAPGVEEDMHPGEGWEVFTAALDQDLLYLADETGTMTIAKYLKHELGWMDDKPMLSRSLGKGRLSQTKSLVTNPQSMPIGTPHS